MVSRPVLTSPLESLCNEWKENIDMTKDIYSKLNGILDIVQNELVG